MTHFGADFHKHTCYLLPALVFNRAVCSNPACGEPHGWMLELAWLWFSLTYEVLPPGPDHD